MRKALCFLLLLLILPAASATQSAPDFKRLTTLWNSPGFLMSASPDGRYAAIYERARDVQRLVSVETGAVLHENPGRQPYRFSPDSQTVFVYNDADQTGQLLRLADGEEVTTTNTPQVGFSPNSQWLYAVHEDVTTTLWDVATGEVAHELAGSAEAFSPNSHLLALSDAEGRGYIVDMETGATVFDLPLAARTSREKVAVRFTPDGSFAIFESVDWNTTFFYSTLDWSLRYQASHYLEMSANSQYLIEELESDPLISQIVELNTGAIKASVPNQYLFFSEGGQYYMMLDSSAGEYQYAIASLETQEVIVEMAGEMRFDFSPDESKVILFMTRNYESHLFDLTTGELIEAIEGEAAFINNDWLWVRPDSSITPGYVYDLATQEKLVSGWEVQTAGAYTFVANGAFVDVYGADRTDDMLPPMVDIAINPATNETAIYAAPDNNADLTWEGALPGFTILGRNADDWLYVSFDYPRIKYGWLQTRNVALLKYLETAPRLDPDDPLGSLREISEEGGS